jgi:hypothetical protein
VAQSSVLVCGIRNIRNEAIRSVYRPQSELLVRCFFGVVVIGRYPTPFAFTRESRLRYNAEHNVKGFFGAISWDLVRSPSVTPQGLIEASYRVRFRGKTQPIRWVSVGNGESV